MPRPHLSRHFVALPLVFSRILCPDASAPVAVKTSELSEFLSAYYSCAKPNGAFYLKMRRPVKGNPWATAWQEFWRAYAQRKVWVSIKFLSAKFGLTPLPQKGPKWGRTVQTSRKSSNWHFFGGGGANAILWTKRFYGHLGVSECSKRVWSLTYYLDTTTAVKLITKNHLNNIFFSKQLLL